MCIRGDKPLSPVVDCADFASLLILVTPSIFDVEIMKITIKTKLIITLTLLGILIAAYGITRPSRDAESEPQHP
jgi:hypothetical protein